MKILGFLLVLVTGTVLAQPPTDILVYHDVELGYGNAVITAIGNRWPACNIADYSGGTAGQTQFNADMASQAWDIIIVESWYYDSDGINWSGINDLYNISACPIFVACWEWNGGTSGQLILAGNMGVSGVSPFGSPVIPHYAWEPTHAICTGISDWGWNDPGLGILNSRFTVSDAFPVTGWTASSTTGQAGICVANDASSVISGYTPAYANESVAIWENILAFMWGDVALERSTWGEIKTLFN